MASKKSVNSFSLLSQRMNEVQKSKNPNSSTAVKKRNSPTNLRKTDSSTTIDLEEERMSPKRNESQSDECDPDVPDRSYGDYFCPLCDSHMNSDAMWTAHISGKRHQKNVDKGSKDPKYDDLDVESVIKQEIKNVKDPVVGLSYLHEIRRKDKGAPSIFTCFLCQATFPTVPLIIEHVLTMKHRMNFMKENSPDDYQLLEATNLKKGSLEPLVEEMTLKLEQKYGRGSVKVKQEKQKVPPPYTYSAKRLLEEEEERNTRKSLKPEDKDVAFFSKNKERNVFEKDKHGRDNEKQRYSSSEHEDPYKRRSSPIRNHRDTKPSYPKRYEPSPSQDSYKRNYYGGRKSISPVRSYRPRSPPPRESIRDRVPYGPDLPPSYHSSSSRQMEDRTSLSSRQLEERSSHSSRQMEERTSHSLRQMEERTSQNPSSSEEDRHEVLKDFVRKICALPSHIFFNIVLCKLDNLDSKNVEDLALVSKVIQKAQEVLCKKLPPELQAVINQKLSQSSNPTVPPQQPPVQQPPVQQPPPQSSLPNRGDFSFIKEFLDYKRSPSAVSSPIPPPTLPQPVGAGVMGIPTHRPPPNFTANQPYGSSGQTYQNQAANSYQSSISSLQNYSSQYQNNLPYSNNAAASSNSSAIPGLNLAEENNERQTYSFGFPQKQSSQYPGYGY